MMTKKRSAEKTVRDIRRATRRKYSAEEKIRIVIEGLQGEDSVAELCWREGINSNVYYRWTKEFMEAGKNRLADDVSSRSIRCRDFFMFMLLFTIFSTLEDTWLELDIIEPKGLVSILSGIGQ